MKKDQIPPHYKAEHGSQNWEVAETEWPWGSRSQRLLTALNFMAETGVPGGRRQWGKETVGTGAGVGKTR